MRFLLPVVAVILSYNVCNLFTHPNSKIWHRFPHFGLKKIELLPSIRIILKGKIIHFHHWFNFTMLLCASIFVSGGILDSWITRGALLGGILQGLSIPEARKIIYRKDK